MATDFRCKKEAFIYNILQGFFALVFLIIIFKVEGHHLLCQYFTHPKKFNDVTAPTLPTLLFMTGWSAT